MLICLHAHVCENVHASLPSDFNLAGKYPTRLGGNGHFWSFSARDSEQLIIGTDVYLAVSSSSVDPSQPGGTVFIYKFDKSRKAFRAAETPGAYALSDSLTVIQVTTHHFLCKLTKHTPRTTFCVSLQSTHQARPFCNVITARLSVTMLFVLPLPAPFLDVLADSVE